ncbi:hypothetical protein TNIN_41311 [Trichonephila inaurata madagascariensis]|uniref:Uncharacterized protein n=1 Tax=Trichonephila inaurata madagascariensis TaxID=2747483 RepID=A0A8X6YI21_9ARAC|nr:hypothetical protein TNIN_41311 [Trichonephila inaurata madagascariensis]
MNMTSATRERKLSVSKHVSKLLLVRIHWIEGGDFPIDKHGWNIEEIHVYGQASECEVAQMALNIVVMFGIGKAVLSSTKVRA